MYAIYRDFKIKKEKGFVRISADCSLELERVEDDFAPRMEFPKCLRQIARKGIALEEYDDYAVYTLNIANYNAVTDHKKVWGLAYFKAIGLYDNHYNTENGRTYLGIVKNPLECKSNCLMENISIFIPKGSNFQTDMVFESFAKNQLNLSLDSEKSHSILSHLQNILQTAIILHESLKETAIHIYGTNIDRLFEEGILPVSEVMER